MSFLTITEFDYFVRELGAPLMPGTAEQKIEIGMTSVQSEPFKGKYILVSAPVSVAIAFGPNPVADPTMHILRGDRIYGVNPDHRLAVIAAEE